MESESDDEKNTGALTHAPRRTRELYRWRIYKLEVKLKRQEFQQEMGKHAVQFSELLENIGTTKNDMERDNARARIIEGWEQMVKTTAG